MPTNPQTLLTEATEFLGAGVTQAQAVELALMARIVSNGGVSQPAAKYLVTAAIYAPTVGIPVTISAQLASASGITVKTSGLVVTWSKTGAGGSFSAPTSVTDANGIATVNFTPSNTAGVVYAITATDTNAMTGTSANLTSVAGAATAYVVTSNNYSPAAGATVAASAQLVDAHGNSVSTSGITVTWSKTGAGGSFSAPTSNTNGSGVATVNFTCGTVAGVVYVLTGTDGSARTGSSSNVTVGPEAAAPVHHVARGLVQVGRARMLELRVAVARPRQAEVIAVARSAARAQRLDVERRHVLHVELEPLRRLTRVADRPCAAVDLLQDGLGRRLVPAVLVLLHLVVLDHLLVEAEFLRELDHQRVIGLPHTDFIADKIGYFWVDQSIIYLKKSVIRNHLAFLILIDKFF